jgi:cell division protein FtsB
MGFWRTVKRRVKAAVPPLLFLGVAVYFGWHVTHGERGTEAREARRADIAGAIQQRAAAQADWDAAQRRVNGLRNDHLDPDQLDERARALLNLTQPGEIVIPYTQGQRLF